MRESVPKDERDRRVKSERDVGPSLGARRVAAREKRKKESAWHRKRTRVRRFPACRVWAERRSDGGASWPRAPAALVLGRHAPSWHRRTYRVARCVSSPRARGVSRTRSVAARARTRRASPAADRTSRRPHAALPHARLRGARPIAASPRRPHPWRSPREARRSPRFGLGVTAALRLLVARSAAAPRGNGIRERS